MTNARTHAALGIALVWVGFLGLNIALLPPRYAPHARVERIRKAPLDLIVRAEGTLEPKRIVTVKTEFDGPVIRKLFKEGDSVRKGQLLLVIGKDDIRLDYERSQTDFKNAKSDLSKARRDARIQKELYAKQAVAMSSVEDAQRAAVRAAQTLEAARESFQQQEAKWKKDKIYAPFAGTIVKDSIGEDKRVSGGKEIATLADLTEYTVSAAVDELEIGRIHEGQQADITMQAYGSRVFRARVSRIGSEAEGSAVPEVPVILTLEKVPDLILKPKVTAVARILTGKTARTLSVPLAALSNTQEETTVWVLDGSNRLRSRKVTPGQSNPDRVQITQGLDEGERVCLTADPHYARGMKVIVDGGWGE